LYLVTGAGGNVGSQVAAALLAGGEQVRGVVRAADSTGALPDGAEPVAGDLNRADSLAGALAGVEGLFLLPGYEGAGELLGAAKAAGVRRLVQLSGGSAGSRDMSNAVTAYMAAAEDTARGSGLDWTILRPSAFMSNALRWLPQLRAGDELRAQFAGVASAIIDPADIGAVAAAALTEDGHAGQVYRLSGPEALTPAEQAAILAEGLGRPLRVIALSNDETRAELASQMPEAYVDAFFDFYVAGSLDESPVLPTVEQITHRPPGPFADWVRTHRSLFR
jgi:uncharacterized protein YbjT (DUF2867 family)